jgi:hypothetical protein
MRANGSKLLLSSVIALMLASCIPVTKPDRTELCLSSEITPGWTQSGSDTDRLLVHHGHVGSQSADYSLSVHSLFFVSGMDTTTYWVKLYARFITYHPELKQPMLYQPDGAWIEINGIRTAANGVVQFSEIDLGRPPRSVTWPVDLLALTGPKDSDSPLLIAFPVPWPKEPHDHWSVHLGSIKLGDEVLPIPDRKSCFIPGGIVWVPFFSFQG